MLSNKKFILLLIFLLALVFRFLYFPQNTYFGFDQARDAYQVREILQGDLKIVGPPTANQIFHHGVLYYYIFAPFYFFSQGDPSAVSLFLRILNASGIFLLYFITRNMLGEVTAILASLLFAVSYEQTQFSLFLNHPSLAVISVLIFYSGLSYWIFRRRVWGFFMALFGLGLSIQFEFVEAQLIGIFILTLVAFWKNIPRLNLKEKAFGFLSFFIPIASYVISEIKNNFPIIRQSQVLFSNTKEGYSLIDHVSQIPSSISRHIQDNLVANFTLSIILGIGFLVLLVALFYRNIQRKQLVFLAIWFFGGFLVYFFIINDAYFYNTGTSIALLVFTAFLLTKLFNFSKLLAIIFLLLIFISNLYLITKNNPLGPNQKINPQVGLLLKDQQKVLDFIYQKAEGREFAVNALTMPYNVNTTWSYLFEGYGKSKHGYMPVWGGDAAGGFPGNLKVETRRSKLPDKRFLIIEPQEGIPSYIREEFLKDEQKYTETLEKRQFGTLQVWVQQAK